MQQQTNKIKKNQKKKTKQTQKTISKYNRFEATNIQSWNINDF